MKIKKFLIICVIFALFLCVSLSGSEGIEQCKKINSHKKITIFTTEEVKPIGRVICITKYETVSSDWMSVEDAVKEKKEIVEFYDNYKCEIFIQYDKWPY